MQRSISRHVSATLSRHSVRQAPHLLSFAKLIFPQITAGRSACSIVGLLNAVVVQQHRQRRPVREEGWARRRGPGTLQSCPLLKQFSDPPPCVLQGRVSHGGARDPFTTHRDMLQEQRLQVAEQRHLEPATLTYQVLSPPRPCARSQLAPRRASGPVPPGQVDSAAARARRLCRPVAAACARGGRTGRDSQGYRGAIQSTCGRGSVKPPPTLLM